MLAYSLFNLDQCILLELVYMLIYLHLIIFIIQCIYLLNYNQGLAQSSYLPFISNIRNVTKEYYYVSVQKYE